MTNLPIPPWCKSHQRMLSDEIEKETLAHAYLFIGAQGAGKRALTDWLISVFTCQNRQKHQDDILYPCQQCKPCLLQQGNTYPDAIEVNHDAKLINVDAIRSVSAFLEKTPQIGRGQTVVIDDASDMTVAAANALLKTLEEPQPNTLLILTAQNTEHLLATIVSRCQSLLIRPFSGQQLIEYTGAQVDDPYINMSSMPELQSLELSNQYHELFSCFCRFIAIGDCRKDFERLLISHERAFLWLERAITTLIRIKHQWLTLDTRDDKDMDNALKNVNSDSLLAIFQLVLAAKNKITSLAQANDVMIKEKLVVDILQLVKRIEA